MSIKIIFVNQKNNKLNNTLSIYLFTYLYTFYYLESKVNLFMQLFKLVVDITLLLSESANNKV